MTPAERKLWRILSDGFPSYRFRRQVPIRHYIADFASHRARLVIEVDGGQHNPGMDSERTRVIQTEGYQVLRFWNNEALGNPDGVWTAIDDLLREHHPHPASPIEGEGN